MYPRQMVNLRGTQRRLPNGTLSNGMAPLGNPYPPRPGIAPYPPQSYLPGMSDNTPTSSALIPNDAAVSASRVANNEAVGPRPTETDEERALRMMQERHAVTAHAFSLLGQLLQLGAVIARGGQEVLSVVMGTTLALRAARFLFVGDAAQATEAVKSDTGYSSQVPHQALTDGRPYPVATERSRGLVSKVLRSPLSMVLIIGGLVIVEHLYRLWLTRRRRQQLDEDERWLVENFALSPALSAPQLEDDARERPSEEPTDVSPSIYVARFAFTASEENQLSLQPGDQVFIKTYDPQGWCWASLTNVSRRAPLKVEGYIPGNFVDLVVAQRRRL